MKKPETKSVQVMTRIKPSTNEKLLKLAKKMYMTRSAYLNFLVEKAK